MSARFSLVFYPVEGAELAAATNQLLGTLARVDAALADTSPERSASPWFLGGPAPSIIDLQFIPTVERLLPSVLYWRGLELRGGGEAPALRSRLYHCTTLDCTTVTLAAYSGRTATLPLYWRGLEQTPPHDARVPLLNARVPRLNARVPRLNARVPRLNARVPLGCPG